MTCRPVRPAMAVLVAGLILGAAGAGAAEPGPPVAPVDDTVRQALQATPDLARGKALFFNCAVCHSPEGWGSPSGSYPQIAGQHQSVILKQLDDIRLGNRDTPTMIPFTAPLFAMGPQALADLSGYIQRLPMNPRNTTGAGGNLERGGELYAKLCAKCHGNTGEGNAAEFQPRIHGQHVQYLLRQLEWIKTGKRRNADRIMTQQIMDLAPEELMAIADYVSRQTPGKERLADHPEWKNPDFGPGFKAAPKSW